MAKHFLFKIQITKTDQPNLVVGDIIDFFWDDDIKFISREKNGVYINDTANYGKNTRDPFNPPPRTFSILSGVRNRTNNVTYSNYSYCDSGTLYEFGITPLLDLINVPGIYETPLSPQCCDINSLDFNVNVTHVTALTTGKITITNTAESMHVFEAILNNALPAIPGNGINIVLDVEPGVHVVTIRRINTACSFNVEVTVADLSLAPPLELEIKTPRPQTFSPVFSPIAYNWRIRNGNGMLLKQHSSGSTMLQSGTGLGSFLRNRKRVRIVESGVYNGTWNIIGYEGYDVFIDAPYSGDMTVRFVPEEKLLFDLYAEVGEGLSDYKKIARIAASPNDDGIYVVRVEGFLQSVFELNPPNISGMYEQTLSRKYYMQPLISNIAGNDNGGFLTAVYSALDDLNDYLNDLVPLGPIPINFISDQAGSGMPTIFSVINQVDGRIQNVVSQSGLEIISSSPLVSITTVPLSTHIIKWSGSGAPYSNLNGNPALPSWIQLQPTATGVDVLINTFTGAPGDYEPADYDNEDYLTYSYNAIVGCYEFDIRNGATFLFKLSICIYPVQQVNPICTDNAVNIAWVNREGGWSSFVFAKGKKTNGVEIDEVKDYKKGRELKKSHVNGVYETMTVNYSNLNQRELQVIASMRHSIQAYLYNDLTRQWDIPIYIEPDGFEILSRPFQQANVNGSFTFRFANEIKVQRQ